MRSPGSEGSTSFQVRAVLCAPVELLWNGGIGTYVKAPEETHGEVGDSANDPVRVDADELRCNDPGTSAAMLASWLPVTTTSRKNRPPVASGAIIARRTFIPECEARSLTAQTAPRSEARSRAGDCVATTMALE